MISIFHPVCSLLQFIIFTHFFFESWVLGGVMPVSNILTHLLMLSIRKLQSSNSFDFIGSLTNLQLFALHRILLLPCRECLEASLALVLEKVCTKPVFPSLWNTHPQTCLQENATSQSPLRGNFGSDQRRAISVAFPAVLWNTHNEKRRKHFFFSLTLLPTEPWKCKGLRL